MLKDFQSMTQPIVRQDFNITSSGNIGIGQDNPAGKLHISSGTSGDYKLIIEADTDNNEGDNPQIEFRQDGGVAGIRLDMVYYHFKQMV